MRGQKHENPSPNEAVVQLVLRQGTLVALRTGGLLYRSGTAEQLSWAGNVNDRRSTSRFAFSLVSAAIVWSSKKHPTVAVSSTDAKYRGAAIVT